MRVLLAEDNLVNQKMASRLLERMGYAVEVVENGALAVEAVRNGFYDVVLMDIMMPEMDGIEATKHIIAEHPQSRPKIIALTANALPEDRLRCLDAGMDDYLAKPYRMADLKAILEANIMVPPGNVA